MMLPENTKVADNEDFYASVYHHLINFEFFKAYKEIKEDPVHRFSGFFENDMFLSKLTASQAPSYKEANEILTSAYYRHEDIDGESYTHEEMQEDLNQTLNDIIQHANSGYLIQVNDTAAEFFLKKLESFGNLDLKTKNDLLTTIVTARNSGNAIDTLLFEASTFDHFEPGNTASVIGEYALKMANHITAVEEMYEEPVHFDEKLNELKSGKSLDKQNIEGDYSAIINQHRINIDSGLENYHFLASDKNKSPNSYKKENEAWFDIHTNLRSLTSISEYLHSLDNIDIPDTQEYIQSIQKKLGEHSSLNIELHHLFKAQECLRDSKKLISELSEFEGVISAYQVAQEIGYKTDTMIDLKEAVLQKIIFFDCVKSELEQNGHKYSINGQLRNDVSKLHADATTICSHEIYNETKDIAMTLRQNSNVHVKFK
ncbi:TPA: hypothetical protein ACF3I9_004486 [Klebsiella aerogenes]